MSAHYLILDEEKLQFTVLSKKKITFEQLVSDHISDGWLPVGGGVRTNGLDGFGYRAWNWAHLYR